MRLAIAVRKKPLKQLKPSSLMSVERASFQDPKKRSMTKGKKFHWERPWHTVLVTVLECSASLEKGKNKLVCWVPEKEQSLLDAIGMAYNLPNFRAKLHSANCKNLGETFTKITIAHDFLMFIYCLHYKFYIIVLFINSSKERHKYYAFLFDE